jgi:hypothetical protein
MAEDLDAVIRSMGCAAPVVVGWSSGGLTLTMGMPAIAGPMFGCWPGRLLALDSALAQPTVGVRGVPLLLDAGHPAMLHDDP